MPNGVGQIEITLLKMKDKLLRLAYNYERDTIASEPIYILKAIYYSSDLWLLHQPTYLENQKTASL